MRSMESVGTAATATAAVIGWVAASRAPYSVRYSQRSCPTLADHHWRCQVPRNGSMSAGEIEIGYEIGSYAIWQGSSVVVLPGIHEDSHVASCCAVLADQIIH